MSIIYKALNNLQNEDFQGQSQSQNRLNLVPEHNRTGVLVVAGVSILVVAVLLGRWLPVDSGSNKISSEVTPSVSQGISTGPQDSKPGADKVLMPQPLVPQSIQAYAQQPETLAKAEEESLPSVVRSSSEDRHNTRKVSLESLPRLNSASDKTAKASVLSQTAEQDFARQLTSSEIQKYRSTILYLVRSEKIPEAQEKLKELRSVMPTGGFIEKLSAYVDSRAGNLQSAYDNYQKLLTDNQTDPVSQFNAALLAIKLKNYTAARKHLQLSSLDNRYMARSNALLASLPSAIDL